MSAAHLNKENFESHGKNAIVDTRRVNVLKKKRVLKVTVVCSFEKKTTCRVGMRAQESQIRHISQS